MIEKMLYSAFLIFIIAMCCWVVLGVFWTINQVTALLFLMGA